MEIPPPSADEMSALRNQGQALSNQAPDRIRAALDFELSEMYRDFFEYPRAKRYVTLIIGVQVDWAVVTQKFSDSPNGVVPTDEMRFVVPAPEEVGGRCEQKWGASSKWAYPRYNHIFEVEELKVDR